ncbi:MAG: hypothetical protein ACRCU1_03500 [Alsobacter sp.]
MSEPMPPSAWIYERMPGHIRGPHAEMLLLQLGDERALLNWAFRVGIEWARETGAIAVELDEIETEPAPPPDEAA